MTLATCLALGLLLAAPAPPCDEAPPCEPGYRWVEEDSFVEVQRCVCKVVPDVKKVKKVVYTTKEDPFCLRRSGGKGQGDCREACPKCRGPFHRRSLMKTEITCEEPTVKCVVEKVVEKVPCKVRRKVPCGPAGPQ